MLVWGTLAESCRGAGLDQVRADAWGVGAALLQPHKHTAQPGRSPLARGQDGSARCPGYGSASLPPFSLITRSQKPIICHQLGSRFPKIPSSQPRFLETESVSQTASFFGEIVPTGPLSPVNGEEACFCSLLHLIPYSPGTLATLGDGLMRTFYICGQQGWQPQLRPVPSCPSTPASAYLPDLGERVIVFLTPVLLCARCLEKGSEGDLISSSLFTPAPR